MTIARTVKTYASKHIECIWGRVLWICPRTGVVAFERCDLEYIKELVRKTCSRRKAKK